jgi:hypothetical protein
MSGTFYVGRSYKLVTNYTTSYATSIARYLQFNTADWYGLRNNAYDSTTNASGNPTANFKTISGLNY